MHRAEGAAIAISARLARTAFAAIAFSARSALTDTIWWKQVPTGWRSVAGLGEHVGADLFGGHNDGTGRWFRFNLAKIFHSFLTLENRICDG
ncbi:hypothetical protein [Burkholderia cenocepacia]|uniref:hypothetical protein n=1 Tax=Burkholderia cenocepacia TaxID=95486 RepID=UPI000F5AC928|nr:hypothetical protein [Burkholderia cenocepacia]ELW9530065.1 hypothetical protein [Burkholderia cenocepacia]MDN7631562.1 hypothetical protein [Burkholderia cenocepacia]